MDCRLQDVKYVLQIRIIENDHMIHASERRYKSHSFTFVEDRMSGAFLFPHRAIAFDGHHKRISLPAGCFETPRVPDLQNVEGSIRKHHLFMTQDFGQIFQSAQLHDQSCPLKMASTASSRLSATK